MLVKIFIRKWLIVKLTKDQIAEMNSIVWFHQIPLNSSVVTPGVDESSFKLKFLGLPDSLTNKTVLDIGAWDGFFSFECEKRGASRVIATDKWVWEKHITKDKGFDFAHKVKNSNVTKLRVSIEELKELELGEFDVVLMLGVLYHALDPLGYLKAAYKHTKSLLIIETHVDFQEFDVPAIRYYPGDTLVGDATNYWGPNSHAVIAMLKDVGFSEVKLISSWGENRQVFHAYKN